MLDIINQRVVQGFLVFNLMWTIRCVPPYINSKYLPLMPPHPPKPPPLPSNPYPFFTSLYRAPQTYDRGKTMSMPRNPYILISKLRPCFENQENGRRHFDKLQRPINNQPNDHSQYNYYHRPPMVKFTETHVQHVQQFQQVTSPKDTEEFTGSWAITKPDNDPTFDKNEDNVSKNKVTYNEDGTRVLPESTYNYNTENTQLNNELFTSKGDGDDSESTSYTSAVTTGFTPSSSSSSSSPPPLTEVSTPLATMETSDLSTMTTSNEVSLATTSFPTFETTPFATAEDLTMLEETIETTQATHRESLTTTIMDKFSGGTKNMLVQFLGGLLNGGGQPQNFKDKAEKQLSEKTILESPNGPTSHTFPSYFNHPMDSYPTTIPSKDINYNTQDTTENQPPTVTTSEVRTSGEHPLIAMATSLAPQQQEINNAETSTTKEEERGSTSGWRPLHWPVFLPKRPPSEQRPPSPPVTIHNWLHTSWNHSSSTDDSSMTSKTDSQQTKSFNTIFNQFEITTSTSIPRLPSSYIEKNLEETSATNVSNGPPPLLLVDWLLGTSRNNDTGKENKTINGNLTDLMNSTDYENKTMSEFVSKEIPVANFSNVSRNWTVIGNDDEWTGRKIGQITENKIYKQEMINVEIAIREMKKLYEKLRLGIPTPFHIFRHLKKLHPNFKHIETITKY